MAGKKKKNQLKEEVQDRRVQYLRWTVRSALALLLSMGAGFGMMKLLQPDTLPIRKVQVEGDFRHQNPESLRRVISTLAHGNFFTVDIAAIHQKVRQQPWIDNVSVQRRWPDKLVIQVAEQKPLARWMPGGLVNRRGEWFAASMEGVTEKLPELQGPEATATMLARRLGEISTMIAPLGLKVQRLEMNDRRSWRLVLDNGLIVRLGRTGIDERLRRFVRVYGAVIEKQKEKIDAVDLRYTNGFALSWKPQPEKQGESARGVKNHV